MPDIVAVSLDIVAIIAVSAFTSLSLVLAKGLKGSNLRHGFVLAASAGLVHIGGNLMQFLGDIGIVGVGLPGIFFSVVQVVFMALLALAVQSFFPAWYRGFRNQHP